MMEIPVFPLNTVLFPGALLPLKIFEQRYLDMLKSCLREDRPFGVFLIREGAEVGRPAVPFEVGCLAKITEWEMPHLGLFHIKALGTQKVRIFDPRATPSGLLIARAHAFPVEPDAALPSDLTICAQVLRMIIDKVGAAAFAAPLHFDSSLWVSYRLAEVMPLDLRSKQELLEIDSAEVRLRRLLKFLRSQGLEA
jgi:Lon protease-like protein